MQANPFDIIQRLAAARARRTGTARRGAVRARTRGACLAALAGAWLALLQPVRAPGADGSGLALPQDIGPLEFMGQRSRADARPGFSFAYRAAGLSLDVDVVELGAALADGSDSAALHKEMRRLVRDLHQTVHTQLLSERTVKLGLLPAREAELAPDHAAVSLWRCYLWLTAARGRLYVLRLDVERGFEEDGQVSRGEVMSALGTVIAHAAPEPSPEQSHERIAILWDPATPAAERALWTVYLYTRAAQAATQSDEDTLPLGVRLASFDEEVRARRMAVSAFRQLTRGKGAPVSPYFADLDRVEAAGYLREYVWRYLQQPSWRALPADLRLAAFDDWRREHLRDHVAVTHGRITVQAAG
ncbi:MAG TPA: hypothetical protein VME21_09200 [Steroidobacteraceae bacterium]|nr:hypothetical protein [Steroidobacteraceae bacterium]